MEKVDKNEVITYLYASETLADLSIIYRILQGFNYNPKSVTMRSVTLPTAYEAILVTHTTTTTLHGTHHHLCEDRIVEHCIIK